MPMKVFDDPVSVQKVKECAFAAINDGYTNLVYNFVKDGQNNLSEMDICKWRGFDLEELWREFGSSKSLPKFKQAVRPTTKNLNEYVKQYTRLTINLDTMLYFNNFKNLNVNANPKVPIINSYDLFAIRPACVKNEKATDPEKIFENVCRNSECDIISIDFGQKFSFFLDKTHIKMALLRGANFEITYSKGMLE